MKVQNYHADGTRFSEPFFVVTYCDYAADFLNYNDTNCETNHTLANQLMEEHDASFGTKAVVKYFD
jgi:hypothetical protein